MTIDRAYSCHQAGYVAKLAAENIQWQKRRCTGGRERPLHFVTCLSAGQRLKVSNGSIPAGQVGGDSEVSKKAIPKQSHECRGRLARTRIRTDPQRPPVALAAQGRDRAGQWTWHRAPRHPHDPAVLGPADVVGIPQRPPILLRRRHRFIQRWGWRGDQGARSKTSTSAALPFARVTPVSSDSRAASPVSRVRPLTSIVPRTT